MKLNGFLFVLALVSCGETISPSIDKTPASSIVEEKEISNVQSNTSVLSKEDTEKGLVAISEVLEILNQKNLSLLEGCNIPEKSVKIREEKVKVGVVECEFNGHIEVYLETGEVEYPVENCKHNGEGISFTFFAFSKSGDGHLKMMSDGEVQTPIYICDKSENSNYASPSERKTLSISDFVGVYSVYGECPIHDWNTGILDVSKDYIGITETACRINKETAGEDGVSLFLELGDCTAYGEPQPDERAKFTQEDNVKSLKYLPNKDGILRGDGRVFNLTPCQKDAPQ